MSEISEQKPVFNFLSIIEIESGTHGLLRLRNWTVKAGTEINRLCHANLSPRQFTEGLLTALATDPLLSEAEVQQWTDTALLEVATKWWSVVEQRRPSPIAVESLEGFQDIVQRRNAEHSESIRSTIEKMTALRFPFPDHSAIERLTESLTRQKRLLDFAGHSEMYRAIERMQFASPFSTATLRDLTFARPERLAIEAVYERMRDAQLFGVPNAIQIARLSAVNNPLATYAEQAAKMDRDIANRLRGYKAAFDAGRLKAALGDLDLTSYKRFVPDLTAFESLASNFQTRWIDRLRPEVSVAGIARMVALSAAAQAQNPFDVASVTTIRVALGDWRELRMPWRLLPDANLREQFYLDHGLDRNLVQLPEPAFTEALASIGLLRTPTPPPEVEEELDDETILQARISRAYALLLRFERKLREYIDAQMTQQFGSDWERHRCHGNGKIYELWVKKREKAVQSGFKPERLIQYADFTEYADLITKADNWDQVFKTAFLREESVRESLHRLGPVRICTMHGRPITKTELMLATAEITRMLIAIGAPESDDD